MLTSYLFYTNVRKLIPIIRHSKVVSPKAEQCNKKMFVARVVIIHNFGTHDLVDGLHLHGMRIAT